MLENVADIAQITHGIRNFFADIRNVSTAFFCIELYRGKAEQRPELLKSACQSILYRFINWLRGRLTEVSMHNFSEKIRGKFSIILEKKEGRCQCIHLYLPISLAVCLFPPEARA